MPAEKPQKERDAPGGSNRAVAALLVGITLAGVGLVSGFALLCVLLDGVAAMLVVVPAAVAGLWLVPLFRLGPMPLRWHLLLGAALGLGAQSLLVLLAGLTGAFSRNLWVVLLASATVAGVVRLRNLGNLQRREHGHESGGAPRYLWLVVCPFLILALLAASNPPGFLWQEEGYGYDVLEYHLQLPKEYLLTGRIEYLPHNVYANFPAGVEMHYLLGMILLNDTVDAGVQANMIHLVFAALTVFAAWVIGRDHSPKAGIVAALSMATAGWLVYLSGLAYVENALLFFGLVAIGVMLRALKNVCEKGSSIPSRDREGAESRRLGRPLPDGRGSDRTSHTRSKGNTARSLCPLALAGAVAGFACGCKYTGVAMIALPLGVATLWLPHRSSCGTGFPAGLRRKLQGMCAFAGVALLTFSPWLIKNGILTGNPVFPLANTFFDARPPGWGVEETRRWDRGHDAAVGDPRESVAERPAGSRSHTATGPRVANEVGTTLGALWRHIPGDRYQRFGPLVLLLALGGLYRRRIERADLMLLTVLAIQLAVWMFATHLFARFAVVLLIPLALLAGRSILGKEASTRWRIVLTVLIVGGVWNLLFAARLGKAQAWDTAGAPASLIYEGKLEGLEYYDFVNRGLSPNAKILLIGDAKAFYFQRDVDYCVVFNRSPFAEAVRTATSDHEIVDWFQTRGYTHVLVNWAEVRRLARTYGFPPAITPDLFDRLIRTGLSRLEQFKHPHLRRRYVELYEVPPRG